MKDKNYLYNMYNATSTGDENDELESYENWLERQLLARVERLEQFDIQRVSGGFLFDKDLIKKAMTAEKPYYAIGVDTYDKGILAYCLTRKIDDVIEVLLYKTMRDETEFKQEVEILARSFEADVFKSGD